MKRHVCSLLLVLVWAALLPAAEIHDAVLRGDTLAVKALLEKNPELIRAAAENGRTPLHEAAYAGLTEMVEFLLNNGANPNVRTASRSTPLHGAALYGREATVKLLVAGGGDVNAANAAHFVPLINASLNGHIGVVRMLLDAGADMKATTNDGKNALLWAAESGHGDVAKMLLDAGSPANVTDSSNMGLLHCAAFSGDTTVVALALQKGLPVNTRVRGGQTALILAGYRHNVDVMRLLIRAGADVNAADDQGNLPLRNAVTSGAVDAVSMLLEGGARTDWRDSHNGRSLLHEAVMGGDKEIVAALLTKVTEVDAVDNAGKSPLYYAERHGHLQIGQLLRAKGATSASTDAESRALSSFQKPLGEGEAVMWYLGHCGFAVKTKNHLLIFDYFPGATRTSDPSLANGHIWPEELKGQNVTVFVTHEHTDHFAPAIFGRRDSIPNLTYVFGFQPEQLPEQARQGYTGQTYEYAAPHTHKSIDGLEIRTIQANDAGVGFVVDVDGLTIYHAGDHAGWLPDQRAGYTAEIDSIAAWGRTVDMAFLNATGCHVQDTIALVEGTEYTLNKLAPRVMIPTHGMNREYYYVDFVAKVKTHFPDVLYFCPQVRGDAMRYVAGKTKARIEQL
jgi:ankyrin repeat protein/L-ascorbate metabolism protein UlaG (beta-lactamase superfamily)